MIITTSMKLILLFSLCLSQGYQLYDTDYRGLVSSYKVEYSYDGNHWIAYVDNKTNQGYRVSGFVSVNKLFVRPDSYWRLFFIVFRVKFNVFSQLSIKKHFRIFNFVSNRNSAGTRTSTEWRNISSNHLLWLRSFEFFQSVTRATLSNTCVFERSYTAAHMT